MTYTIKSAEFITSSTRLEQLPKNTFPEIAFIGRSNVGKSALINFLTNHKALAKTSSRPGKTQTINHFLINNEWYLVDLPGYGYAQTSKKNRSKWSVFTVNYLTKRENLHCVFLLIDSSISPQKVDLDFIRFMGISALPFVLVFNKIDKQSPNKIEKNIAAFCNEMKKEWEALPPVFKTSTVKKQGKELLLNYIASILQ